MLGVAAVVVSTYRSRPEDVTTITAIRARSIDLQSRPTHLPSSRGRRLLLTPRCHTDPWQRISIAACAVSIVGGPSLCFLLNYKHTSLPCVRFIVSEKKKFSLPSFPFFLLPTLPSGSDQPWSPPQLLSGLDYPTTSIPHPKKKPLRRS